ncbi:MAG: DUF4349 domain-containing protein [Sphingobacteriaceae bacterium]|nr:MAG: DUF4349 domain-containing protein [Sphingobacteriaceae bacterium]
MKSILLFLTLLLALTACNQNNDGKSSMAKVDQVRFPPPVAKSDNEVTEDETNGYIADASAGVKTQNMALEPPPTPEQAANKPASDTQKKIVKEGTISFETSDLAKTRSAILKTLQVLNGYVSEENQSNNEAETRKEYSLKIRVPAQNFDRLLDTISAGAEKIDAKNISISDITTNYIDAKARFDNKKLLENRYNQLLAKATKISDLLEIENKLTEIRSDIESAQGQLNYMNKQVAYSSLDVTFYTKTLAQENGNTFGYRFKNAFSDSWELLQSLFFGMISLWPFILIGVVVVYFFLKRKNK